MSSILRNSKSPTFTECAGRLYQVVLAFIVLLVRKRLLSLPWPQLTSRYVGLALYRALLQQCSPSRDSPAWLLETRSLVKQRFRRYKDLQSPSQVANALKAGYRVRSQNLDFRVDLKLIMSLLAKTLDLLDSAANGNQQDAQNLTSILEQAKSMKEQYATLQKEKAAEVDALKRPLSKKQARKAESIRFQEATRRRHPDTPSILDYSQRGANGRRKVPFLVNARGIPFLRFKKPQPQNLSGVIRAKLENRWHLIERRDRLREELLLAKDEDLWDRITNTTELPKWSREIEQALGEVQIKIKESDRKSKEMAERMWNIVLVEREKAKTRGDQGDQGNLNQPVD